MKVIEKPKDFDDEAFRKQANEIYQRHKQRLEPENRGKIVAIEVENGDIFISDTVIEAGMKARLKYPEKFFYFKRIGYEAVANIRSYHDKQRKNVLRYGRR